MKRGGLFLLCIALMVCGLFLGLALGGIPACGEQDEMYQVSTINALLQGDYDGVMPFSEVEKHGDFGIATFDGLDGEMVALDGQYYQVKADGKVHPVTGDMTTPFATVTWFSPDFTIVIPAAGNFTMFGAAATRQLPSENLFYAVKIQGEFPYVRTRSIPKQEKPYPRLVDASANQSVFEFRNTTGTVVGFWTPSLAQGLNVPGFHLHYLTADRTAGGHILDFALENATVLLDETPRFTMVLPTTGSFVSTNLTGDLSGELAAVEQGGSPNNSSRQ
jgi:acetolactate decarboxylase